MEIRKAKFNDFEKIKEIMLAGLKTDPTAFTVDLSEYAGNPDSWWKLYLNDYLIGIYAALFLAFDDSNNAKGIIGVIFNKKQRMSHVASIVWFYVLPEVRGFGTGKKLLEHAIAYLSEFKHIRKVNLTVVSSQEKAIKIYKKSNFSVVGVQKDEIKILGSFYDFVTMERHLD